MKKLLLLIILIVPFILTRCNFIQSSIEIIDFDSNLGTPVEAIQKLPGKDIEEPDSPTRDYYTFEGWYSDRELTVLYIFDKMPSENIILYAKWSAEIVETPEGVRLILKYDDTYGVESYVGTEPILVIPSTYLNRDITSIEVEAFSTNMIITNVILPNTITEIRTRAFDRAKNLQSFEIPSSVVKLEGFIFLNCTSLTSITFAPGSNLEIIDDYVFYELNYVHRIILPESITEIGEMAFLGSGLRSILFESDENLKIIGKGAFAECEYLEFIVIPASVTSIGEYAFTNTRYTTLTIYSRSSSVPDGWVTGWSGEENILEWGVEGKVGFITYMVQNEISREIYLFSGEQIDYSDPGIASSYGQFVGWYLDSNFSEECTLNLMPEYSLVLYAKFSLDD